MKVTLIYFFIVLGFSMQQASAEHFVCDIRANSVTRMYCRTYHWDDYTNSYVVFDSTIMKQVSPNTFQYVKQYPSLPFNKYCSSDPWTGVETCPPTLIRAVILNDYTAFKQFLAKMQLGSQAEGEVVLTCGQVLPSNPVCQLAIQSFRVK